MSRRLAGWVGAVPVPAEPDRHADEGDTQARPAEAAEQNKEPERQQSRLVRVMRKPAAWLGAVATGVVIAVVSTLATGVLHHAAPSPSPSPARAVPASELQVSTAMGVASCNPPPVEYLDQSVGQAESAGYLAYSGIPVGAGFYLGISNQTFSTEAILLTGLTIKMLHWTPAAPSAGILVRLSPGGCTGGGGGVTPRYFSVAMAPSGAGAVVSATSGPSGVPAVPFPFYITSSDPEQFDLLFLGGSGEYTFDVELHWIAAGHRGVTTLTSGGKGFQFIGSAPRLPLYQQQESNPHVLQPATTATPRA
jgi:hypothetical protein